MGLGGLFRALLETTHNHLNHLCVCFKILGLRLEGLFITPSVRSAFAVPQRQPLCTCLEASASLAAAWLLASIMI